MCETFGMVYIRFSLYVLNGFKKKNSWGFVFLNSLSMFALLCSAHIFSNGVSVSGKSASIFDGINESLSLSILISQAVGAHFI
jgi:hypothetical protein